MTAASSEPEPWQVYGERLVYDNRWVQLALVDVQPPHGKRFEHHVVRLPHAAIAAILDDQKRVLMIWRYRFVPRQFGWELPGGLVDAGEDAATTAAREVEEETGWRPTGVLRHIASFQPMVGMVDAPHDIFIGQGAQFIEPPPEDPEEQARPEWIPLADIPVLIERGEILGAGTYVAMLHLLALDKQDGPTPQP